MKHTIALKKLAGLDPTPTGIGSQQRITHECTVCRTEFDTTATTCPQCGSHTFRNKETTPNATFNLLFVLVITGFAIVYNVLTSNHPESGPGA